MEWFCCCLPCYCAPCISNPLFETSVDAATISTCFLAASQHLKAIQDLTRNHARSGHVRRLEKWQTRDTEDLTFRTLQCLQEESRVSLNAVDSLDALLSDINKGHCHVVLSPFPALAHTHLSFAGHWDSVAPPSRLLALVGQAMKWQQHVGLLPKNDPHVFRGVAKDSEVEAELCPTMVARTELRQDRRSPVDLMGIHVIHKQAKPSILLKLEKLPPATASSIMGYGGNGKGWGWSWPPMWIDPEMKIWIGNLPEDCNWKDLQTLGNTVGSTRWVEVFRGKGKGTGMIAYKTAEDVSAAMKALPGQQINGQAIEVDAWQKAAAPAEA
eukprot:Skav231057  [mRNA]  locus=scaffold768:14280:31063:+ [translate_table: standard]